MVPGLTWIHVHKGQTFSLNICTRNTHPPFFLLSNNYGKQPLETQSWNLPSVDLFVRLFQSVTLNLCATRSNLIGCVKYYFFLKILSRLLTQWNMNIKSLAVKYLPTTMSNILMSLFEKILFFISSFCFFKRWAEYQNNLSDVNILFVSGEIFLEGSTSSRLH